MGEVIDITAARAARRTNRRALDGWTVVHALAGALAAAAGAPRSWAYGGALAYEAAEQALERTEAGRQLFGTQGPESLPNVAADMAAFAAGYELLRAARM